MPLNEPPQILHFVDDSRVIAAPSPLGWQQGSPGSSVETSQHLSAVRCVARVRPNSIWRLQSDHPLVQINEAFLHWVHRPQMWAAHF